MSEKEVEGYLVRRVKSLGGKAYKFVSPANAGVPDRLVCLPDGTILFVELKAPGKKSTPLQENRQRELKRLNQRVFVVDSRDEIDRILKSLGGIENATSI